MWKKKLAILGAAGLAFLAAGTTSYAGGINAAEQRIIDYYSGTFTYNGKTYVFTESAKATAYDKLASDDVDLTDAQASSAIRQGRSKLRQGIEEGYLVEAGSGGDDDNGDSGDNGNGSGNNGSGDNGNGSGGNNSGNSGNGNGSGNNGSGDNGNGGSGDNGTGGNGSGNNGSGDNGNGNGGSGDNGNGGSGGNGSGNGDSGDNGGSGGNGSGDNGNGSGNNGNNGGDNTGDGNNFGDAGNNGINSYFPQNSRTVDMDALFRELDQNKEYSTVYGLEGSGSLQKAKILGNAVTADQYLSGKSIAVTRDGQVLLETDLPIKNTGFYNGGTKRLLILGGIVFACAMLAVIGLARSRKNRKAVRYIVAPLAFTLALVGFFGLLLNGALGNQLERWKSLWIAGAPGYSYAYAAQAQDLPAGGTISREGLSLPLSGDQYGELACEKAGLQAPLYYGDTEEVLQKGAGTYAGSYLPGMGGTILVGAHDATFFAPLEKMGKDDVISLTTTYGIYQYRVTKTQAADIMDASAYQISKDGEMLVLYTCYPFGAEDEVRNQRFYVYAEKISGPEIGE